MIFIFMPPSANSTVVHHPNSSALKLGDDGVGAFAEGLENLT
jgi:hypothetical protein